MKSVRPLDNRSAAGDCREHRSGRSRPRPVDPAELVAAVTATRPAKRRMLPRPSHCRAKMPRNGSAVWYLLFAGVMLLAAETVISNHLSRKEKFL